MARDLVKLVWNSTQVATAVAGNLAKAYAEFGLRVEGNAKRELKKGHGVLTGTLRRSIHTAQPGYNWENDDLTPSKSSPELGGAAVEAAITTGMKISLLIGSGLKYALAVHQGHHNFQGYHYLTNALEKTKPELAAVLEKHKLKG